MGYLLLPLGIFAGWIAGAAMSRRMVRSEVQRLESLIESGNRKSAAGARGDCSSARAGDRGALFPSLPNRRWRKKFRRKSSWS